MLLQDIEEQVRRTVSEFSMQPEGSIVGETQLIGPNAILKSRQLVEVLLALEEFAEDSLGTEFHWQSDSAMSAKRSTFRTVASIAQHLDKLQAQI